MSYDRRDESIMNHSVSTGGSLLKSPAWGSNGIAEFVGEVRFFAVDGPPMDEGHNHMRSSCLRPWQKPWIGKWICTTTTWRSDPARWNDGVGGVYPLRSKIAMFKKNEVSCPAKKRVLPRSDDGWMFYYFLWYVSCWFLMESSIHQAVEITYLVSHCSGSLLLAKQEQ